MKFKKEAKGLRLVLGYFGLFMIVEGFVTLFPLTILAFYPQEWECYLDFLVPGGSYIGLGFLLWLFTIAFYKNGKLGKNEDALLLVLLWISAFVIGAFPFWLTKFGVLNHQNPAINLNMSFTEAFFESTSGYSATGLTVIPETVFLTGVDSSSYGWAHVFLFHRTIMQFIGGVGLVLLVASVISSKNNFKLFFAEGHNDRLLPNLGRNAKLIFGIYFGWIAAGTLALWTAGMTPFDAFCHSTAALATGGFSTRSNSIMFYSSETYMGFGNGNLLYTGNGLIIEGITLVLMIAGATNFVLHTFLLSGKIKHFAKDVEIQTALFLIIVCTIFTSVVTFQEHSYTYSDSIDHIDFWTSLRYSVFNIVSSITTTGFTNFPSITYLGHFSVFVGLVVMTIGGGMGSTAGGLKQYRVALLLKEFRWSFKYKNSSDRYLNVKSVTRLGQKKEVDDGSIFEATNYTVLYVTFLVLGTFTLLCLKNTTLEDSIYEWGTSLSGTGISIMDFVAYKGDAGVGYYNGLLWALDVAMLLGRLEILPVFYALNRFFVVPLENAAKKHQANKAKRSLMEQEEA